MNRRAITPIIEQFFIFAMGIFLFAMVVTAFRGLETDYLEKTGSFSVQLAGEYVSFSIMNVQELKNIGKSAVVEATATVPHASEKSKYYLEVRGSNITVSSGSKSASIRVPAKIDADGNAYTAMPINIRYSDGKINLKGGRFD